MILQHNINISTYSYSWDDENESIEIYHIHDVIKNYNFGANNKISTSLISGRNVVTTQTCELYYSCFK